MRKKKGKILVKSGAGVAHYCATGRTARANPLEIGWFVWLHVGTAMPTQARAVPVFWSHRVKKISLFLSHFGQSPTKPNKITQNKKNKSN